MDKNDPQDSALVKFSDSPVYYLDKNGGLTEMTGKFKAKDFGDYYSKLRTKKNKDGGSKVTAFTFERVERPNTGIGQQAFKLKGQLW
jgi:hypothetical protein